MLPTIWDTLPAAGDSRECFADEVAIDFPSVDHVVERLRDAFLGDEARAETLETRETLTTEVSLSRRDATLGTVVPLDVPMRGTCVPCGGRGEIWTEPCPACSGRGDRLVRHPLRVSCHRASSTARASASASDRLAPRRSASKCASRFDPPPPDLPASRLLGALFVIWGALTILIGVSTLALGVGAAAVITSSGRRRRPLRRGWRLPSCHPRRHRHRWGLAHRGGPAASPPPTLVAPRCCWGRWICCSALRPPPRPHRGGGVVRRILEEAFEFSYS